VTPGYRTQEVRELPAGAREIAHGPTSGEGKRSVGARGAEDAAAEGGLG